MRFFGGTFRVAEVISGPGLIQLQMVSATGEPGECRSAIFISIPGNWILSSRGSEYRYQNPFRHYHNLHRMEDRIALSRDFSWDRMDRIFLANAHERCR
jgi:hypothetical protein